MLTATGLAATAAVTTLALPAGASQAGASQTAAPVVTGTQHFQAMTTSASATKMALIAYGVFTAPGTDRENVNGTDTFIFSGGSFGVKHIPAKGGTRQSFNPKTCLMQINQKGTFKLSGGTGKYKGISGSGTYTLSILAVGPKLKNGTCNPSQTALPVAWQQEIAAVGKVKLP
jgi:hypothetical protein